MSEPSTIQNDLEMENLSIPSPNTDLITQGLNSLKNTNEEGLENQHQIQQPQLSTIDPKN